VDWKAEYWRLVSVEGELEASRKRYAALYDSAPVGYATLDRHGWIREINLTGARILGRSRATLIGGTLASLVTRPDQRKFLGHLKEVQAEGIRITVELHFQRPDKKQLLLQLVSESTSAENGELGVIHTIFSDVTGQRQTEMELYESRAELAAITASAVDAIISINRDQRIVQFNAAAEMMFGRRRDKAIGQPVSRLFPEQHRENYCALLQYYSQPGATAGGCSVLNEIWGLRTNGKVFPIEASISQTEVGGQNRLTVAMRDITERKNAEREIRRLNDELEQRVRERTAQLELANQELHGEVAERRRLQQQLLEIAEREQRRIGQDLHDGIGQQLTGLMLLNDTLLGRLAEKAPSEVGDGRRLAELLGEVRAQVRQLSRGLQPVWQVPDGLMTALSQLAEGTSTLHAVECRFCCKNSVMVEDNLVATHLFRIAQEAVHNAIRHGCAKRITINLTANEGAILVIVEDNGRGLAPGNLEHSDGLGLQIMKSRCEAIGGQLTVGSANPRGTRIECRVPSETPDSAARAANSCS
jgi:PAS domain S-box-containing protein